MSKFNSDVHFIYCCGQETLRRNGVAFHDQQRSPRFSTWVQHKNDRMISGCFRGKPFNRTVTQVCAPATSAKEDEGKRFYEDLPDLLELTAKKRDVLYIIGDWIAKIGGQKMEYYFGLKKEGNLRCLTDTEDLAK